LRKTVTIDVATKAVKHILILFNKQKIMKNNFHLKNQNKNKLNLGKQNHEDASTKALPKPNSCDKIK
jgi:hypothetical protein